MSCTGSRDSKCPGIPDLNGTDGNFPILSVIIPCYNEVERIGAVLAHLLENLSDLIGSPNWEIVVSDDGSTDGTRQLVGEVQRSEPRVRTIAAATNSGKGAAVKVGLDRARAQTALIMDSDLSADLSVLPKMLNRMHDADLVVGDRFYRGAVFRPPRPLVRRVASCLFRFAVRGLGLVEVSDPQCGFKVLSISKVLPLFGQLKIDRYAYEVEMLSLAKRAGLRVVEVPVVWTESAGSKVHPIRDGAAMFLDLIRIWWAV